jgi:Toprim domain-containing protein
MTAPADHFQLKQALRDRCADVAEGLLGSPNRRLSNRRTLRWGTRGSLVLNLVGRRAGKWRSFETGERGDLLDLIQRETGGDFRGALEEAERILGGRYTASPSNPRSALIDEHQHHMRQRDKARWLWRSAIPARGTLAEKYLRGRGITCDIPETVRFLRPHKPDQHPALTAPFGLPAEPFPGVLAIAEAAISAVQLTLLSADGHKADVSPNKITIGRPSGQPIVLAPLNDLLGLVIAEGIEDGLTLHQETGLGAWAAGGASHMSALANAVPDYANAVTIIEDDDTGGAINAHLLAANIAARGIFVEIRANKECA